MAGPDRNCGHCRKGAALRAIHRAGFAGDQIQHRGARAGHGSHRYLLHNDHQLSIQSRRRHSALDFSVSQPYDRDVHHCCVRDRIHRPCRHGVGSLSGRDHRVAGDRNRHRSGAAAARKRGRLEWSTSGAAGGSLHATWPADADAGLGISAADHAAAHRESRDVPEVFLGKVRT